MNCIAYVAGNSGGHITPALTLIEKQKTEHPNSTILFFAGTTPLDYQLLAATPSTLHAVHLPLRSLPGKQIMRYPLFVWRMLSSLFRSLYALHKHKPKLLISTGGIVSVPVVIAAAILRIPIDIYELNVIPGQAVAFTARFSRTVHVCFAKTRTLLSTHTTLTPYPIRLKNIPERTAIMRNLTFDFDKKTVLVVGGSQGSAFLNTLTKDWLSTLSLHDRANIQVIHQTGAQTKEFDWKTWYAAQGIKALVFDYSDAIAHYYQIADLIICRSGAGTLFEIAYMRKQCITIPLQTKATAHQVDNAHAMAKQYPDLFTVFLQKDIEKAPQELYAKLTMLLITSESPQIREKNFSVMHL